MTFVTSLAPLRYRTWQSRVDGRPAYRLAAGLLSLTWLPVGCCAASLAMTGEHAWAANSDGWPYLAGLVSGGVPLALACGLLRRMGHRIAACMAFGVLGPATAVGSVYLAPLGPLWIAAGAAAISLAAWLPYGLARHNRRARRRNNPYRTARWVRLRGI